MNTMFSASGTKMERRPLTPPTEAWEATEAPNSLQSAAPAGGQRPARNHHAESKPSHYAEIKQRLPESKPRQRLSSGGKKPGNSHHAESKQSLPPSRYAESEPKQRPSAGGTRESTPDMTRKGSAREEAAKRWIADTDTPPSSSKRKRPLHHPPGLPSLASPSGTHLLSNSSPPPQQQSEKRLESKSEEKGPRSQPKQQDSVSTDASSADTWNTAQRTALQCVDHASKRQAAAKAALAATSQISTSLKDLMGDSNRALSVARQSRVEAENAATRAESAAKKVRDASDLAAKDRQRASLELEEANAQAEEAWEFLRRVKGTSKGHKKSGGGGGWRGEYSNLKRDAQLSSARIGTIVEVCEDSTGTSCSSVGNQVISTFKKAESAPTGDEPNKTKSDQLGGEGRASGDKQWKKSPTRSPMKSGTTAAAAAASSAAKQDFLVEPMRNFKGHTSPITQIASLDDNRFVSCSWDTTIRMWNAGTGECTRVFRGHTDWVHAISVLDGTRFISGSDDRTIKLWHVDSDECVRTYTGHTSFVKALAPLSGDRFLSGSRDRTIKLFSISSGECIRTFEGHVDVVSALVAIDANHFASGSHDTNIRYWNDGMTKCVRTLIGHSASIKSLAAVSKKEVVSGSDDKTIRLWDVTTGKCLREFGSKNALVFSLTYVCEGFFLSCGGNNIKLYHVASGECVKSYETPRISLAVARLDDERFVTGSDQMLHLWKF